MEASIQEAVRTLGISESTLRRRLRSGLAVGRRKPTAQGFVWVVEVDRADQAATRRPSESNGSGAGLKALPAPQRPWWRSSTPPGPLKLLAAAGVLLIVWGQSRGHWR